MLHLAADEPDARIPATEGEVISYAERVKRAAIRQWFAVNGLSSCVHRGAGRSCTGKDRKGCVLHTWEVKTSLVGSHVTLRYTMPNPLDPSKPLRFLEVRIDSGARACLMTYGTLGGRPCTVSQEWLDRASASAKVEFVVNDVEWLDYVCPQWPLEGDVVDETEERDPVVIPKAQVGFNFYYLPAVLGFFLPEVGHAQQCVCVSSKQYFCRIDAIDPVAPGRTLTLAPAGRSAQVGDYVLEVTTRRHAGTDRALPASVLLNEKRKPQYPLTLFVLSKEATLVQGAAAAVAAAGLGKVGAGARSAGGEGAAGLLSPAGPGRTPAKSHRGRQRRDAQPDTPGTDGATGADAMPGPAVVAAGTPAKKGKGAQSKKRKTFGFPAPADHPPAERAHSTPRASKRGRALSE